MHAWWLMVVAAGCAARVTTTPVTKPVAATTAAGAPAVVASAPVTPVACPSVPLIRRPHTKRPWSDASTGRCYDLTLSPGVDRVPFGRDIDDALFCLDAFYESPGALPLDAMLAGAATELARVYPALHVATHDRRVTLTAGARHVTVGPAPDLRALLGELLGLAEMARAAIAPAAMKQHGNPEHVLVNGAFGALVWKSYFVPREGDPQPPTPPALAEIEHAVRPSAFGPITDGIAYVRVGRFERETAARFRRALGATPELRGVILDLRGSPGGLLDESVALSDLFVRHGCLAVLRNSEQSEGRVARDQPGDVDAPLVVLVDRFTAAGAELVAQTLRARGRAVVVGEPTFGNGVIRVLFDLGSGAKVHLPIAEFLASDGTAIENHGLTPDREVPADFVAEAGFDRETSFALHLLRERK